MKKINHCKMFSVFGFTLLVYSMLFAGEDPSKRPSPTETTAGTIDSAVIKINYSSPSVKGRKIWGELVPYNEVWRAGANEATTFETDKDLKVEGKLLPAGKYGLFAVPTKRKWEIIFNKVADQWGAFKYEKVQDALRVKVKTKKTEATKENLSYQLTDEGFKLLWENIEVPVSVKVAKK